MGKIKQINFRIDDDGYTIIKEIADSAGLSVSELSKQYFLEKLQNHRVELALELFRTGKIGLKRAWKISGLTDLEFRRILIERNIEPFYDAKLEEIALENAMKVNLKDHLKK